MPLLGRPDADLVRDEPPVRRIMPFLMRGRNESLVYQDTVLRVHGARAWLRAYNRAHTHRATLFHLVAYAVAVALHERPRLNRYVAGYRLWKRREVSLAFVAKKEMSDDGADVTVKVVARKGESFTEFSARLAALVDEARSTERAVDREIGLFLLLPTRILALGVKVVRLLDHWHLLPGWFTRDDPMYASVFLANLGSVGISDAYHHLYEYGTCSIFGTVSATRKQAFVDGDRVVVDDGLTVRWTLDERIDDGYSAGRSIALVQRLVEDPARHLGAPDGAVAWRGALPAAGDAESAA
jgi:hypothetical protein